MGGRRVLAYVRTALLAASTVAAIVSTALSVGSLARARVWFVECGYVLMAAAFACSAVALGLVIRDSGGRWRAAWSRNWHGAAVAVAIASLAFAFVPHRYRVLNDELQLLSVARTMTLHREAQMEREVWTRNPEFKPVFWIDKRPLVFPFLISATHTITGYRTDNVFAINAVLLAGFLFALHCLLRRYVAWHLCAAALLLVAGQPIVLLCGTSGGYETCYLLLLVCALLALRHFLDAPSTARFELLVFAMLLFANVQYTAVLLLIIALGVLAALGHVERRFLRDGWLLPAAPFFLLPVVWQRLIMAQTPDPSFPAGTTASAFGWKYLPHNAAVLPTHFFSIAARHGLAGAVNVAGVIALAGLAAVLARQARSMPRETRALLLVIGSFLAVSLLILLFYYSGIDEHPMNGRLYVAFVVLLSAAPVLLAQVLLRPRAARAAVVAISALALTAYFPVAVADDLFRRGHPFTQEMDFLAQYWKQHPLRNSLVIYKMSHELAAFQNDAIDIKTAARWRDLVASQRDRHVYDSIYVVQTTDCASGVPFRGDVFDPSLPLTRIAQTATLRGMCVRISVVE